MRLIRRGRSGLVRTCAGDCTGNRMKHWTLDNIAWDRFDPSRVDPDLLHIVKAAAWSNTMAATTPPISAASSATIRSSRMRRA